MGRIRFAWLALVAILALAACQTTSQIDGVALTAEVESEIDALAVATPWKGWYDWVVTYFEWDADGPGPGKSDFGGACAVPSDYLVRGAGRGQFTHMGRIAFENQHCGRYADGAWEGAMTFVAADRSTIVTTYAGGSTVDYDAEAYVVDNEFTIAGGTGRFAGATGGGPGGAWLAWEDEVPLFSGEYALRMWIDGRIVHAPGKALGR